MKNIMPGNVVLVDFGEYNGHLQGGIRPAMVLGQPLLFKENMPPVFQVIPLSTRDKGIPYHVKLLHSNLNRQSFALIEQITTINASSIIRTLGGIAEDDYNLVKEQLIKQLALNS